MGGDLHKKAGRRERLHTGRKKGSAMGSNDRWTEQDDEGSDQSSGSTDIVMTGQTRKDVTESFPVFQRETLTSSVEATSSRASLHLEDSCSFGGQHARLWDLYLISFFSSADGQRSI